MFNAAMIAKAYTSDCIEDIILSGLEHVPVRSRLAEAIRDSLHWRITIPGFKGALDKNNLYRSNISQIGMIKISDIAKRLEKIICKLTSIEVKS